MGLTQVQLSRALNISQGALSGYETGRYDPDVDTMKRMADFFNVTLDELFGQPKDNQEVVIADIDFALSGELRDLSEAEKQDVLDYVRFKRAQRARQE
jgi:transcriptional regulator with XRE-family HTH domain